MKSIFLAVLVSVLSLGAFADSQFSYSDSGGKLWLGPNGLRLSGATLQSVDGVYGFGSIAGPDLGTVSFSTGQLLSGSLQLGGTFAAGGNFEITGNGIDGLARGLVFSGTFSSPVSWTLTKLQNGTLDYILSGTVTGTIRGQGGATVEISQISFNTGTGYFSQVVGDDHGGGNLVSVPEADSLSMLAMSLAGIGGALWRKLIA